MTDTANPPHPNVQDETAQAVGGEDDDAEQAAMERAWAKMLPVAKANWAQLRAMAAALRAERARSGGGS